jgi:cytochrome P450
VSQLCNPQSIFAVCTHPWYTVLSLWSLQRRLDLVGPDADQFGPSRWETWKPKQWEFIPFNHGVRTCLGKNFGQEQVEYLIARLAQEYSELKIAEEQQEPMEYKFELNVKPAWPCLVRFVK